MPLAKRTVISKITRRLEHLSEYKCAPSALALILFAMSSIGIGEYEKNFLYIECLDRKS
jgi:hypothetical protein